MRNNMMSRKHRPKETLNSSTFALNQQPSIHNFKAIRNIPGKRVQSRYIINNPIAQSPLIGDIEVEPPLASSCYRLKISDETTLKLPFGNDEVGNMIDTFFNQANICKRPSKSKKKSSKQEANDLYFNNKRRSEVQPFFKKLSNDSYEKPFTKGTHHSKFYIRDLKERYKIRNPRPKVKILSSDASNSSVKNFIFSSELNDGSTGANSEMTQVFYFNLKKAPITGNSHLQISRDFGSQKITINKQENNFNINDKSSLTDLIKNNSCNLEVVETKNNQTIMMNGDFYKPIYCKKKVKDRIKSYGASRPNQVEIRKINSIADKISTEDISRARKQSDISVMHLLTPESPSTPVHASNQIDKYSYTNKDSYNSHSVSNKSFGRETAFFN